MTREEALNKVRQMSLPKETMEILEALAPELAESENERIRKTLIDALKTSKSVGELKFILPEPTREECLAYLEKQGEQKVSVDDFKAKDWYVSKVDGKIHNIYYSVDKVKPKFKVGDWIVFNGLTLQVKEVVKGFYRTISKGGITNSYDWSIDNLARLCTIQETPELKSGKDDNG